MNDVNGTKQRLLSAAGPLFAAHGFAGTTMRDIAERAGVNLAAANYHFGSKRDLYVAVLRDQFAAVRAALERRGAVPPPAKPARRPRPALGDVLAARCRVMMELLLGPPPSVHGALMQRELTDPTEALPLVLAEFIAPMTADMAGIVTQLEPDLPADAVQRCVFSCVAQVVFYRLAMPAVLGVLGVDEYSPAFVARTAAHISDFSRGGLARVARTACARGNSQAAPARRGRPRKQVSHASQS